MTTDITELAQREKFEAWWERTQHNGNPPRFGWSRWRDGEGYKVDDDDSELEGMWEAWKAAGAELVEALEKAQATEAHCNRGWIEAHEQEAMAEAAEQRIAELESRTVKLPKLKMLEDYLEEVAIEERKQILVGVKLEFHRACVAAGIKVEAE
ncbi:TPA: hypothetical protein ACTY1G_002005 [Klebsiella michiganensis]